MSFSLSEPVTFRNVDWKDVPASPGVYVIYDKGEVIYDRITHPRDAKAACHEYIIDRCAFRYRVAEDGKRALEGQLKTELSPTLNP